MKNVNVPWDGGPGIPPVAKGTPEERRRAARMVLRLAGADRVAAVEVLAMLGLDNMVAS